MKRQLSDWLTSYLEYTENTEPPILYKTWVGMSAIAGALQRKCYLEWGHMNTYPNLFVALVGPSGVGKSQAMAPGRQMLRNIGIKMAAESMTREALIRELSKSALDHTDSSGLVHSHSSLTVHSSELAVFVGYQNRQLISDLCDLYDCADKWEYRTKDPTKADEVIGVYLNVLGAITPSLLQAALPPEAIGGGLTSRMICVYEEQKAKAVPAPFLTKEDQKLRLNLVEDLTAINQQSGQFHITNKFLDAWIDWYMTTQDSPPFENVQFDGYFTRRPLHILKMCMVLSTSEQGDMVITDAHLARSLKLLERTEVRMRHTFEGVGKSSIGEIVTRIMRFIAMHKTTSISELNRIFYHDADRRTIEESVRQIQAIGFCDVVHSKDGTEITHRRQKDGRPKSEVSGDSGTSAKDAEESAG